MRNYLSAVELGYRLPDGRFLFNNLTFSFSAVRAGLVGANGVGKTTLLEILAGARDPSAGAVNRRGRISYLPQSELRSLLGRFLFIRDAALKPASVLSGGERMRAGLACLLGADQSPEILIADEPTNNVEEIGVGRVIDLDCYCLAPSIALDYLL